MTAQKNAGAGSTGKSTIVSKEIDMKDSSTKFCSQCRFYNGDNCHASPPTIVVTENYRDTDTNGPWVSVRPMVFNDDVACRFFVQLGEQS